VTGGGQAAGSCAMGQTDGRIALFQNAPPKEQEQKASRGIYRAAFAIYNAHIASPNGDRNVRYVTSILCYDHDEQADGASGAGARMSSLSRDYLPRVNCSIQRR